MAVIDLSIQTALDNLKRSDFMRYLDVLEQQVTSEWENASADRQANLAQGQKKLISRIRRDIANAEQEIARYSAAPANRVGVY